MSTQTTIQIRVDSVLKKRASDSLKKMGLDLSSGIKLFLNEVTISETIPFYPRTIDSKKLRNYKQLKKEITEAKKNGKKYGSVKELFEELNRSL